MPKRVMQPAPIDTRTGLLDGDEFRLPESTCPMLTPRRRLDRVVQLMPLAEETAAGIGPF